MEYETLTSRRVAAGPRTVRGFLDVGANIEELQVFDEVRGMQEFVERRLRKLSQYKAAKCLLPDDPFRVCWNYVVVL